MVGPLSSHLSLGRRLPMPHLPPPQTLFLPFHRLRPHCAQSLPYCSALCTHHPRHHCHQPNRPQPLSVPPHLALRTQSCVQFSVMRWPVHQGAGRTASLETWQQGSCCLIKWEGLPELALRTSSLYLVPHTRAPLTMITAPLGIGPICRMGSIPKRS